MTSVTWSESQEKEDLDVWAQDSGSESPDMLLPRGCHSTTSFQCFFYIISMMYTYWTYIEIAVVLETPNNHQVESYLCHKIFPAVSKPTLMSPKWLIHLFQIFSILHCGV